MTILTKEELMKDLQDENKNLVLENEQLKTRVNELETDIKYLKKFDLKDLKYTNKKAKKLMQKLLDMINNISSDKYLLEDKERELVEQVEQFLKECE